MRIFLLCLILLQFVFVPVHSDDNQNNSFRPPPPKAAPPLPPPVARRRQLLARSTGVVGSAVATNLFLKHQISTTASTVVTFPSAFKSKKLLLWAALGYLLGEQLMRAILKSVAIVANNNHNKYLQAPTIYAEKSIPDAGANANTDIIDADIWVDDVDREKRYPKKKPLQEQILWWKKQKPQPSEEETSVVTPAWTNVQQANDNVVEDYGL